jgi:hypothetical protein
MPGARISAMPSQTWKDFPVGGVRLIACVLALTGGALRAQTLIEGSGPANTVNIYNADAAILESQEVREDLPCTVTPIKPVLGFDLKFHSGYEVSIPLKELAGTDDLLTMIFRVSPVNRPDETVYMSQRVSVPPIDDDAKGEAYLQGSFDLGEGRYHVDWLLRDRSERACSFYWDTEAMLPPKDQQVDLEIQPGIVQPSDREIFKDEPPVERAEGKNPLNVKILVNFAPQQTGAATLQPLDINALVSILRNIAREPRIGKFSVVAFNLQDQRVLYRQEDAPQIDFPALGEALNSLKLGTINVKQLSQKRGETDFLAKLIIDEMNAPDHPDAVIFAGPKVMLDDSVPQDSLRQLGGLDYPVFYMNYILHPQAFPWHDTIGNAVRYLKGEEYTISRPRDLWYAWGEIMSRIVKLRVGRHVASAASQ